MVAAGYFYNLTFFQLGLHDLGARNIGTSEKAVATNMAYLDLITCATALAFGALMQRRSWGRRFVLKLRISFAVVLVQGLLTAIAPQMRTEPAFFAWVLVCAVALGIAVPVTFGMAGPTRNEQVSGSNHLVGSLLLAGSYPRTSPRNSDYN